LGHVEEADMTIFCDFPCRPPAPRRGPRASHQELEMLENSTKDHGMR